MRVTRMKRRKPNRQWNGKAKKVKITGTVEQTRGSGNDAFYACVKIGKTDQCAYGRNPRKALANAVTYLAHGLMRRKGSFRGKK